MNSSTPATAHQTPHRPTAIKLLKTIGLALLGAVGMLHAPVTAMFMLALVSLIAGTCGALAVAEPAQVEPIANTAYVFGSVVCALAIFTVIAAICRAVHRRIERNMLTPGKVAAGDTNGIVIFDEAHYVDLYDILVETAVKSPARASQAMRELTHTQIRNILDILVAEDARKYSAAHVDTHS